MIKEISEKDINKGVNRKILRLLITKCLFLDHETGNTEFFEKAYELLNLHNNERLADVDCNGMKVSPDLKNHIYEDIREIITEEIVEKGNDALLTTLAEYYNSRFPEVGKDICSAGPGLIREKLYNILESPEDSDLPKMMEKLWTILYCYLYGENKQNSELIESYLYEYALFWYDNTHVTSILDELEQSLGVENLKDNKLYQKFLSKNRKELTQFLDIKYGELEKFFADAFINTDDMGNFDAWLPIFWLKGNLRGIAYNNNISVYALKMKDSNRIQDIVKWNFENLCASLLFCRWIMYGGGEKIDLKMFIGNASPIDPAIFITGLTASCFYDFLILEMKGLMAESCRNFSFSSSERNTREQVLSSENTRLKEEAAKLTEELNRLKSAIDENQQRHAKELNKITREYEKQIHFLKDKLSSDKESGCGIRQEPSHKDTCINLPEEDASEEDTAEEDAEERDNLSEVFDKKILFLGGARKTTSRLKKKFKASTFISNETAPFPSKIDLVVVLSNYTSHALVEKCESLNSTVRKIFCSFTNADAIVNQILESL